MKFFDFVTIVILIKRTLDDFGKLHSKVAEPLNNWYNIAKKSDWGSFEDVKKTFNGVDAIGNAGFVFNIIGNHFRLVAMIFFDKRTIYIRFIGTHSEYDKINANTI